MALKSVFLLIMLFYFSAVVDAAVPASVAWTLPTTISSPNQDASSPQVGIDSSGNVVAVWIENGFVLSSTMPVKGNWSSPTTISGSGASVPQLTVDSNGNATAVWVQNGIINAASQPFGKSWGASTALSLSGASSPQMAEDAAGNVVAVWVFNGVIQSATHLFGGSWPGTPDTISATGADSPQVAIGANGNVVAVWHGVVASINAVFAANKSISQTWNAPQVISSPTLNSVYPKVAVDANGNAVAIWFRFQFVNTVYSNVVLQGATGPFNGNWTTPVDISLAGMYNPALLVSNVDYDGNGNAAACWNTSFDGSTFYYEAAVLPAGGGWSMSIDMLGQNLYAYAIELAVDAFGHASTFYMFYDPIQSSSIINYRKMDIFAYKPSWSLSSSSLSQGAYNGYPQGAVASNGNQIYIASVWLSYNGANTTLQAVQGTDVIFSPPSNLSVVQNSRNNFIFTEYYNTLSWQPSTSPNVTGYYVFRNGKLINSVTPDVLQIIDENRSPSESVTYGVAAFSNDLSQSHAVNITYP